MFYEKFQKNLVRLVLFTFLQNFKISGLIETAAFSSQPLHSVCCDITHHIASEKLFCTLMIE